MKRLSKKSKSSKLSTKHKSEGARLLCQMPEKELLGVLNRLRLLAANHYYGSLDPEDLVNETLKSVLAGDRGWRSDWTVDKNLYWNLRSIASNELQKDRRLVSLEETIGIDQVQIDQAMTTENLNHYDILERLEDESLTKTTLDLRIKGDSLLKRIVDILLDTGKWKPKEIAARLDVDPKVVYPQKRRLQRRFATLRTFK